MKPIIIGLVLALSLAVSIGLIATMPNPTEVQPEPKTVQTKLYTIDDLADNPELYNLFEATQIISKTYNDLLEECEVFDLNSSPFFDCTEDAYSWWQEASLIIQRAYQP